MVEKGRLHFIPDKAKVNSKLYCESLLPKLIEDCKSCLSGFIFQQDRAPAHTAKLAQNWIPPTALTSSENTYFILSHPVYMKLQPLLVDC